MHGSTLNECIEPCGPMAATVRGSLLLPGVHSWDGGDSPVDTTVGNREARFWPSCWRISGEGASLQGSGPTQTWDLINSKV